LPSAPKQAPLEPPAFPIKQDSIVLLHALSKDGEVDCLRHDVVRRRIRIDVVSEIKVGLMHPAQGQTGGRTLFRKSNFEICISIQIKTE